MIKASDRIAAESANAASHHQPGYGTFGTHMEVSYPITGVVMDIDRLDQNMEEKTSGHEGWRAFSRAFGTRNST